MQNAQNKIEAYQNTVVGNTYKYQQEMNGKQEGDPVKAAKAIIDYVYSDKENLRLPLGKVTIQGMRAKLAAVEKDIAANESISISTVYE